MMNKFILFVLAAFTFQMTQAQVAEFFEGEILVQTQKSDEAIKTLLEDFDFLNLEKRIAPDLEIFLLSFDATTLNHAEILRIVSLHPSILIAQNNHKIEYRDTTPNDPLFTSQWQYINNGGGGGVLDADLDAELAWDITTGGMTPNGDQIVICVIDDGLNPNQVDFGDNVWINELETPNNGIDDDGNGFIDDYEGWDADNGTDNIYETGYTHGTSVAGIVGAKGNNGIGVTGVNWDVKIMIVEGGGGEADALAAYAYPLAMRKLYNSTFGVKGAFVVATNASWGVNFGQPSQAPLWCNFYDSLGVAGIINAGATINDNVNVDAQGDLPTGCSSDYLISVTNLGRDDSKVTFAGYGVTTIDLGAYGAETFTTADANDGFDGFGGTSAATPHVSGAVGLIYSAPCQSFGTLYETDPGAAALKAKEYILEGGDDNASIANNTVTGKRLNLYGMLMALDADCINCPLITTTLANNVTQDEATLVFSADAAGSIIGYTIRYRIVGSTDWIEIISPINVLDLTSLLPNTLYEYQIQSNCADGNGSYSASKVFTTLVSGIRDANNLSADVHIYPNPTNNVVTIAYEDFPGNVQLRLTDVTGKSIYEGQMNTARKQLDISVLSSGVYFLRFTNVDGASFSTRIQKK